MDDLVLTLHEPATFNTILERMAVDDRRELEVIVREIADAEIGDDADADEWEALAGAFAARVLALPHEDGLVALQLAACMMKRVNELRGVTPSLLH